MCWGQDSGDRVGFSVDSSQQMKFIDDICQQIVAPPRLRYSPLDLGRHLLPASKRHDFTVTNPNGFKLHTSFYQNPQGQHPDICVIYLHSMNGSRLESLIHVEDILKLGVTFCSFDFSGCGNSEGEVISFGANEKYDVNAVVEKLIQKFGVKKVVLWGRSMGSACAVKYCQMIEKSRIMEEKEQVLGIILDSCFKSFSKLVVEIGNQQSDVPAFLVKAGFMLIKNTLEQKAAFKTEDLEIQSFISNLSPPALFLTSREDTTVRSEHSQSLYNNYNHPLKKLVFINGSHNQSRDQDFMRQIKEFITTLIQYDLNRRRNQDQRNSRVSRFEKMMEMNRNYVFQGFQTEDQHSECGCSLLPPSAESPRYRRATMKRSGTQVLQKLKVKKISQQSPYHFKSSKNLSTLPYK